MLRKCIVFSFLICLVVTSGAYAQSNNGTKSEGAPVTKRGMSVLISAMRTFAMFLEFFRLKAGLILLQDRKLQGL